MMRSLHARVALLWSLMALLCVLMVVVLWMADHAGPRAQILAAETATRSACTSLQQAHRRLVAPGRSADAGLLNVVVDLSLQEASGIEGGIWEGGDAGRGFIAYAFPTYDGSSRKLDVPESEKTRIAAVAASIDDAQPTRTEIRRGQREVSVLSACQLADGNTPQVAWAFKRVAAAEAQALQQAIAIAAVALGVVLLAGAWFLMGLRTWSRRLQTLETALSRRDDDASRIAFTGERDLDRLVLAFNASAARIADLSASAERLGNELAQAARLGALGRVAAGLAHEIRNPLGSIRLRAENALAVGGDTALERRSSALANVLKAVARIDTLVSSLLALTQPMRPQRVATDVAGWLADGVGARVDEATARGIALTHACADDLQAEFDPLALGRALDNLLQNAIRHTPAGGRVHVDAAAREPGWRISVTDTGPGVSAAMRHRLFEPFASGRAEGTGLGLAIAHEIVAAHGGKLLCIDPPPRANNSPGARFDMELPWHAS